MRYIKTYEEIDLPEIGDYVLITLRGDVRSVEPFIPEEFEHFLNTTIGRIDSIEPEFPSPNIKVMYTNSSFKTNKKTPKNLFYGHGPNFCFWISEKNILHRSKLKKDLQVLLDAGRYNL